MTRVEVSQIFMQLIIWFGALALFMKAFE